MRAVDVGSLLYIGQADAVATTTTTLFHLGKFPFISKTFCSSGIERFKGERRKGRAIAEPKNVIIDETGTGELFYQILFPRYVRRRRVRRYKPRKTLYYSWRKI